MNMLGEEEDDSFHTTRESYPHLRNLEWEVVGRMSILTGEFTISGMLESQTRDGQHAAINKFLEGEIALERQKVALISQQGSYQSATGPTHARRTFFLKIVIPKYKGDEDDSLLNGWSSWTKP